MNTNYQEGCIVQTKVLSVIVTGRIANKVQLNGGIEWWVEFFNGTHNFVAFNEKGIAKTLRYYSQLEVIGHIGENIALDFANYCLTEGYSTNATPDNFKKFLETYKPSK